MISLCRKDCNSCVMRCVMFLFCKCGDKRNRCMVICPNKFGSFTLVKNTIVKEPLIRNKPLDLPIYIPVMPDKIK